MLSEAHKEYLFQTLLAPTRVHTKNDFSWNFYKYYNSTYMHNMYSTRNSSGDEIANVNFLCDDIVHALKIQ